jgi:hypothetical protein
MANAGMLPALFSILPGTLSAANTYSTVDILLCDQALSGRWLDTAKGGQKPRAPRNCRNKKAAEFTIHGFRSEKVSA